ncbi:MAG: DNA mismatch repair endonuclease MutL [Candidatus Sericytochromatia bacterium]|nr:DNA mismatch repair endonuclease MutL [Candidatus Sericytochromatia bacterium]
MKPIQLLDAQVANQIAAGEVVERPASVIKELVENALDAGATFIQVEVDQGGRFLRVVDNGFGIPAESVGLAFQRFATSKLQSFEDIWSINTMGFRGEALPSIASVARVEILTRTADQDIAKRLVIQGGEIIENSSAGGPVGTSLTIRDLFYNTPARLKFLSSETTELGYIQQLMQAFALGLPEIGFKFVKKGKTVIQTSGQQSLSSVVRQILGKDLADSLYTVSHETPAGLVQGVLSYPDCVRRDRNYQFLFVNRRWVKVPGITKLVDDLYADLVPKKNFPVAILQLELPAGNVDVNVHPNKKEVKFKHFSQIFQLTREGIQNSLSRYNFERSASLGPPVVDSGAAEPTPLTVPTVSTAASAMNPVKASAGNAFDDDDEIPPFAMPLPVVQPSVQEPAAPVYASPLAPAPVPVQPAGPSWAPELPTRPPQVLELPDLKITPPPAPVEAGAPLEPVSALGQACDYTYIVAHYGNGLALLDQHVAEERYLYEELLEQAKILSQPLLLSVVIEIDEIERGLLEENRKAFERAGFEWEEEGPGSIAIRAIPHCLRFAETEATFKEVLLELRESGVAKVYLESFNRLCKTIACHSAIRAGDPLTLEQMQKIVQNWSKTRNPYTCPHGRPILLKFSKLELNKRFLRTW